MLPTSIAVHAGGEHPVRRLRLGLPAAGWSAARTLFSRRAVARRCGSALGGLLVGTLSAFVPEVWGNGYSVRVARAGRQTMPWPAAARWCSSPRSSATSLELGQRRDRRRCSRRRCSSAPRRAACMAQVAALLWLPVACGGGGRPAPPGHRHGRVLTAATHAPLMAITMVLEMTQPIVRLTVPVMLACAVSYAIS